MHPLTFLGCLATVFIGCLGSVAPAQDPKAASSSGRDRIVRQVMLDALGLEVGAVLGQAEQA